MNCFSLAWRSVIRKPAKSTLLFLAVFIISLLLLSGISSGKAGILVQDSSRQAIGAGLLLERNMANRRQRMDELSKEIGDKEGSLGGYHQEKIIVSGFESYIGWTDNFFETLLMEDIKKIAETEGIEDYNVTTIATAAGPVNFTRIEDEDVDQHGDPGGVTLIGNLDMSMDSHFLSGNAYMKSGRMIEKGDRNVCVISEELANKNHLEIGGRLTFCDCFNEENPAVYEAEIIGIYQVNQPIISYMSGDTYRSENIIFTDLDFPQKVEGKENDPLYERAYFKLADVDEYKAVKEAVKRTDIEWERYDLIDNNGNIDVMSANFNELEKYSEILTWVISGAGLVILILIFLFWIKNRNKEVGIMLSMGVSKIRILAQILTEALIIVVAAVLLSFLAAPKVSELTADYLVQQQVQNAEEQDLLDEGKVASSDESSDEKSGQKIQDVHTEITSWMLVQDALGIAGLTVISVWMAVFAIFKKAPKDIVSEMI